MTTTDTTYRNTHRYCTSVVEQATVIMHRTDSAKGVEVSEGALPWALDYAASWFDRNDWARTEYRSVEVALRGEVVATWTVKPAR
jgi:hypothetical protein